ncbi:MAG TPA: UDP-N-acetylmuramoyl-L-alanyl-D-glutamate--2,6-diaminopimelate ligase, partial [Rhizomicrobium sp.]|nr:UDP-N-acetylmuramoyl-L-alanyl-D-glutamate--2,6-diaminopimelate ligase [Rhizomicrobium sp.]
MGPYSEAKLATGKAGSVDMTAVKGVTGLASDSREVRPGYLFAAIPGTHADGARFIADAVKRGATAVLARADAAQTVRDLGVRFIADENPRLGLARAAAAFYPAQPATIAAVTGTNGKTSVAVFLRQIWATLGTRAASLGTIGVVTPTGEIALRHTTPDPVEIHRLLAALSDSGVDHLALEASSHGLDQFRLDGVKVAAAAFTNLTRDHLDYHANFESYLAAKLRLFSDIVADGGVAVVNADSGSAAPFIAVAARRHLHLITVGEGEATLKLLARTPHEGGQTLRVAYEGATYDFDLPLAGSFQASNALVAAALAIGLGANPRDVFMHALPHLKGAPGRLEKVAYAKSGAAIYVDYAHTPDALQTVLSAIRPHVKNRLHVVFGCGGDRDKGKRPLMGKAACTFADHVIITDDNPRSEDPATIRSEALAGCASAQNIGDRGQAIAAAIAGLGEGDTLVIAGKGHESGQTIGAQTRPFSDRDEAIRAASLSGGRMAEGADGALWTSAEAAQATLGEASAPFGVRALSIDTRTLQPGDLFVALKGDNRDGHDFVAAAFERGASAALVSRDIPGVALNVANTQRGLEDLARAARARSEANIIAVTGSAGKTTTKEILRVAFGTLGKTHAS